MKGPAHLPSASGTAPIGTREHWGLDAVDILQEMKYRAALGIHCLWGSYVVIGESVDEPSERLKGALK